MKSWGAIFDWDGVIINSMKPHEVSWRRLAKEEGLEVSENFLEKGFGFTNERFVREVLKWTRDEKKVQELSTRKEIIYRDLVQKRGVELIPGTRAFLLKLRSYSIPCVIGSATQKPNITLILEKMGLADFFVDIVSVEDVLKPKPDPEVFILAARRMNFKPNRCVVFEDTPVGVQAAHSAGMRVIALTATHSRDTLKEADQIVERLDELSVQGISEWIKRDLSKKSF